MAQQLNVCPVRRQALLRPNALAIKSDQRSLSYLALDDQLKKLEKQLFNKGLKRGDRLVCIAANSLNLILLQLSCMRSGIIFCPINPRFSEHEIQARLAILESNFICSDSDWNDLEFDFSKSAIMPTSPLKIAAQQVTNIIFTSGSSGQPKAVMHSFSNHFYSAQGSQSVIPLMPGDLNLLSLPIFHISGYATVFRTMAAGATLLLSAQKLSVALLKKHQITHLSLVSTQLQRLLTDSEFKQENLNIKHLLLGGSTFSAQLLAQTAQRNLTYHLSYGLTEMSSQVATSSDNSSLFILENREVKIVDNEILLRGKCRFVGYFNAHAENCEISPMQWFASKDLGIKMANQLQIIGRKNRQFICGGENIQPEEIESLLVNHPAVKQAHVIAVNDLVFGLRPVAFVDWQSQPDISSLDNDIRSKLTTFKCPVHYFPLPLQKGLKVSLQALKKLAEQKIIKINTLK